MTARGVLGSVAVVALLANVPFVVHRDDVLNFLVLTLLTIALAQSWNIVGGYAGQVNLGHAAFFGLGALVTRTLWIAGTPVLAAMVAGAIVAVAFALAVGGAAFRLRGAYFAIGTRRPSQPIVWPRATGSRWPLPRSRCLRWPGWRARASASGFRPSAKTKRPRKRPASACSS